jgi:hypothetical protein
MIGRLDQPGCSSFTQAEIWTVILSPVNWDKTPCKFARSRIKDALHHAWEVLVTAPISDFGEAFVS